jgi:hypothetical protein
LPRCRSEPQPANRCIVGNDDGTDGVSTAGDHDGGGDDGSGEDDDTPLPTSEALNAHIRHYGVDPDYATGLNGYPPPPCKSSRQIVIVVDLETRIIEYIFNGDDDSVSVMADYARAAVNLEALLALLETLVDGDAEARAAIAKDRVTVQMGLRGGPVVHLEIDRGAVRHGVGPRRDAAVRLEYPTARELNAAFAGAAVMPKLRKGLLRIGFLKNRFPVLTERLGYYLQGPGSESGEPDIVALRTRMMLRAMLAAVPALARHDITVAEVAEGMLPGRLLVRVEPDGPWGSVEKTEGGEFFHTFERPVTDATATLTFRNIDAARAILGGASFAAAIGRTDVLGRGCMSTLERASEILARFGTLMATAEAA